MTEVNMKMSPHRWQAQVMFRSIWMDLRHTWEKESPSWNKHVIYRQRTVMTNSLSCQLESCDVKVVMLKTTDEGCLTHSTDRCHIWHVLNSIKKISCNQLHSIHLRLLLIYQAPQGTSNNCVYHEQSEFNFEPNESQHIHWCRVGSVPHSHVEEATRRSYYQWETSGEKPDG